MRRAVRVCLLLSFLGFLQCKKPIREPQPVRTVALHIWPSAQFLDPLRGQVFWIPIGSPTGVARATFSLTKRNTDPKPKATETQRWDIAGTGYTVYLLELKEGPNIAGLLYTVALNGSGTLNIHVTWDAKFDTATVEDIKTKTELHGKRFLAEFQKTSFVSLAE